jgi:sortase (surface protein transpeptidase)
MTCRFWLAGEKTLTLVTCYPFYFIGTAPKRFIVHARQMLTRQLSHGLTSKRPGD